MTLVHSQSFEGDAVVECMRPTFTIDAVVLLSDVKMVGLLCLLMMLGDGLLLVLCFSGNEAALVL